MSTLSAGDYINKSVDFLQHFDISYSAHWASLTLCKDVGLFTARTAQVGCLPRYIVLTSAWLARAIIRGTRGACAHVPTIDGQIGLAQKTWRLFWGNRLGFPKRTLDGGADDSRSLQLQLENTTIKTYTGRTRDLIKK